MDRAAFNRLQAEWYAKLRESGFVAAFNRLQAEWDAKLRESGFVDLEERSDGRLHHQLAHAGYALEHAKVSGTVEYYQLAGQYQHDAVFHSRTERLMWELHAEGLSYLATKERLGGLRCAQKRQVRDRVLKHRKLLAEWKRRPDRVDVPERSLLEQHLEAEGMDRWHEQRSDAHEGFRSQAANRKRFEAQAVALGNLAP